MTKFEQTFHPCTFRLLIQRFIISRVCLCSSYLYHLGILSPMRIIKIGQHIFHLLIVVSFNFRLPFRSLSRRVLRSLFFPTSPFFHIFLVVSCPEIFFCFSNYRNTWPLGYRYHICLECDISQLQRHLHIHAEHT